MTESTELAEMPAHSRYQQAFSFGDHSHGKSLKLFIAINNSANFLHFCLVHIE